MIKKCQIKNTKRINGIGDYTARALTAVIIALTLAGPIPIQVEAAPSDPVDLQLGGEGSTPWNIGNVKPSDNGTKVVELHNAGTKAGFVTIWISDVINREGLNPESETGNKAEPGELDKHLLFGVSSNRSSTTVSLPATIGNLPRSESDPNSIEIVPLRSGETVSLAWRWSLPALTGNDVQGDSLSFTLNYLLMEMETTNVSGSVTPGGVFTDNVTVTSNTTESKLVISQNTTGKTKENQPLSEIWLIDTKKESAVLSSNTSSVGTQYEVGPQGTTFDRPVTITMNYYPADIPARASEDDMVMATWDESAGKWTKLSGNIVNKINKTVTAQVTHFSRYTILVYVPPPPPPPTPSPRPSPPIGREEPPPVVVPEVKEPDRPVLTANILGNEQKAEIEADGTLRQALKLTDPDGYFSLEVDQGSKLLSSDDKPITRIEVTKTGLSMALPSDTVVLSSVYRVTGYVNSSEIPAIYFNPSARITILYDPKDLPENAFPPFIANNTANGIDWVPLEPPSGSSSEIGKAKALIYHASLFAALAKVAPPPLPLPPEFEASSLKISPERVQQDKTVTITLTVANKGAVTASYELYLMIDGIVRAVQEITLVGFSSKTVSFEVSNLAPGTHWVKVAGLTGEFQIIKALITLPAETTVGWIFVDLSAAILIGTLLTAIYLVIRKSRRLQDSRVDLDNLVGTLRGRDKE